MRTQPMDACTLPLKGTQLIEASAGTGKTYTITTLHLRLLVEEGLKVEQILVTTFTRAATAELKARLRVRLQEAVHTLEGRGDEPDDTLRQLISQWDRDTALRRLKAALADADRMAVLTIHSFCQRMLQDYAFESGAPLRAELIENQDALLEQCLADDWARTLETCPPSMVTRLIAPLPAALSPGELTHLAKPVLDNPHMTILPALEPMPDAEALDAVFERWDDARAAAYESWPTVRSEIWKLLKSPSLKKNIYREKSVDQWVSRLDALLPPSSAGPGDFGPDLVKLTTESLLKGTKKDQDPPEHPFFDHMTRLWETQSQAVQSLKKWQLNYRLTLLDRLPSAMAKLKSKKHQLAYSDLLQHLDAALHDPARGPALAARIHQQFPAALVDEFQDTDTLQFRVIERALKAHGVLFMIGDPKQAIYGFRGADIYAYLRARKGADQAHTLPVNYRSDPSVLRGIAHLFNVSRPFLLEDIDFPPVQAREGAQDQMEHGGSPIQLACIRCGPEDFGERYKQSHNFYLRKEFWNHELPHCVAHDIVRLLNSGAMINGRRVQPSDIAVLVKKNDQARTIHQALSELRVPASMDGDASVLKTDEASDIEAWLAAVVDPQDAQALCTALSTRLFGLDAAAILSLQSADQTWDQWSMRFHGWRQRWQRDGILAAFRDMLQETDAPQKLLKQQGGERALTNQLHIADLLQQVETEQSLGPAGLLQWIRQAIQPNVKARGVGKEATQIRLESEGGAVRLMTTHGSKGLEFPIVFAPFLTQAWTVQQGQVVRFHDAKNNHRRVYDLASDQWEAHKALHEQEQLAEGLRLLYVTLTRAKHQLHIYWGSLWGHHASALGWLLSQARAPSTTSPSQLRNMSNPELMGLAESLARTSDGAIDVRYLSRQVEEPWFAPNPQVPTVHTRTLSRSGMTASRVGSFSSVTHGASDAMPLAKDHDADIEAPSSEEEALGPRVLLADFPKGRHAGICLHEIFEHIDFTRDDDHEPLISQTLHKHGFDADLWTKVVTTSVTQILNAPLGLGAPALCALTHPQRLDELEFTFPVRSRQTPFDARALSDAMAKRNDVPWGPDYAQRLRQLDFEPLQGSFRGFIDLVFQHDGKFYVVDYKSNHLGERIGSYEPTLLLTKMSDNHYLLQAHLYVLALHRYLSVRLRDYRYEQHMGGYRYAFLRGMNPERPGWSVFSDCPPLDCIDALDRAMSGIGRDV